MSIATTISMQTVNSSTEEAIISSFPNYGLTWLVYIGLTLLMVAIIYYAFRKLHFIFKWFCSSIILAGALTPAHPTANSETYSPLVLNSVVNLFDDNKAGFIDGLTTIGIVWVSLFILGLIIWFAANRYKTNGQSNETASNHKSETMATPVEPTVGDKSE